MKSLFKYFIDRSLLVNMISLIIFIVGTISMFLIKKDTFPEINFDVITISTTYPGASAEDVEKLVTIPLERKLKEVDGIEDLNALSFENKSVFNIQVDPDADIKDVYDEIKSAIDSVSDLPVEVEPSTIKKRNNKFRSILKISMMGEDQEMLKAAGKELRDQIELIPEVASIDLGGVREYEYRIQVDLEKLNAYELTLSEVVTYIKDRNLNLSAGTIKTENADIMIRTLAEFTSAQSIEEVVVRSNKNGLHIRVKDIAKVTKTFEEESSYQRSNGKRAIYLEMSKRFSADVLKTTDKLKKVVEDFQTKGKYPEIKIKYTDDLSFYVKRRLGVLTTNGIQGMVLVFLCLLMFLNFRVSFVTSFGIPLAFMLTFIIMDSFNLTLNLISMFGLILVLGMLVDDSIIVAEYFYQNVEQGMERKEAALKAATETLKPVLATILTTILAFSSLFFIGGIMGKFIWQIPLMVIICLLASLFECFFILPGHLADFTSPKKDKNQERKWFTKVKNIYKSHLTFFLKHYQFVCLFFLVLFIASVFMAKKMRFELFPNDDAQVIAFNIQGDVGTPLIQTDIEIKKIEKIILEHLKENELEQLRSITGQQLSALEKKQGSHYGVALTYLTISTDRKKSADQIMKEISQKITTTLNKKFTLNPSIFAGGPPKKNPMEIEFYGDSLEDLVKVANNVKNKISQFPGILSSEIDFEDGKQQIIIEVNEKESKRLGLTTKQIAYEIRQAFALDPITSIKESDEDINLRIYLDDKSRASTETLHNLFILNKEGRRINLGQIAKTTTAPGAFAIRRFNGKRIVSLFGNIDRKLLTPLKMEQEFTPLIKEELKNYPQINFSLGGETKDTKESILRIAKAGSISILSIFLVLIAMFGTIGGPLIIMSAIPLGLIGVVLTFLVFDKPLSFMALLGVVGLIGVVVNDSIVLVNFIGQKREEKIELFKAVLDACIDRLRPVFLTTFTTVGGLLPLAHSTTGDPFLKPMALAFAYGLLFATMITLIFVPCLYIVYEKTVNFFKKLFTKKEVFENLESV